MKPGEHGTATAANRFWCRPNCRHQIRCWANGADRPYPLMARGDVIKNDEPTCCIEPVPLTSSAAMHEEN